MGFDFRDSAGRVCSSTEFAKSLLADLLKNHAELANLGAEIAAEADWRRNYQRYFYELTKLEISRPGFDWGSFASELPRRVTNESGASLFELAQRGFSQRFDFQFETVIGDGLRKSITLPPVTSTLTINEATPDALHAIDWVRAHSATEIGGDILVALAGNAELAATKSWLDWGGTVAVLARKNDVAYAELIGHAKASAGTLHFVPEGLDLVQDIEKCAHFIRTLSHRGKRLVVASYGYAPGANQIKLQAAQLALTQAAMQLPKAQIALAWLATPLDVITADLAIGERQIAGYRKRSLPVRLRDQLWRLLGQLQPCAPEVVDHVEPQVVFDCSSNRQGPSYLFAKHSERWMALQAARTGVRIAFNVAPPATTRSVLGAKKVLERTYRGLARFGVKPLEATDTANIMAALLMRGLHDPNAPQSISATAIHAGFWSLPYKLDSVFLPATILG